jgi:hypothetical protein
MPTGTPIQCFISHAGVAITQNTILLTVNNDSDYPVTISEVTAFYNASSPSGQGLVGVFGDGTLIWDGFISASPITIENFFVDEQIAPHTSKSLKFFFNKNIKIDGTEKIMISFVENGCPIDIAGY